jgi:hypothetical protein
LIAFDNRTEARTGVAAALAAGSMPALQPGRKFAISAGYGNFQGDNAFGVGGTALLYDSKDYSVVLNTGAGVGVEKSVVGRPRRGLVAVVTGAAVAAADCLNAVPRRVTKAFRRPPPCCRGATVSSNPHP